MPQTNKNLKRVVLNLPVKTAATLDYLINVGQFARTKSDLIIQLLNDFIDKKRDVLNDTESWRKFIKGIDGSKQDKVDEILKAFLESE